ncbi:MAG: glutaredoxin 3 [Bacteriovoracaceae bacterium]|nr:glutaredoxin 3 [Bacteriovoracaceae bacterium]
MPDIIIYSKDHCPYCTNAKNLLTKLGLPFKEIDLTNDVEKLKELVEKTKHRTVPQIFINSKFIGGFDSLVKIHEAGELK